MKYLLKYRQPYEVDEDSSDGIGDHSICYQNREIDFRADNDKTAKEMIDQFLSEGGVLFNHFSDGDGKTHPRQSVELTCIRLVL